MWGWSLSSIAATIAGSIGWIGAGAAVAQSTPIAIVPVQGVQLAGALSVTDGKAMIASSGSIVAGLETATVTLPHRGSLNVCATTKVSLTSDTSVAAGEEPGLMLALEHGALEANFATGKNSDVILTPDFRILISGPGAAQVQVRLGAKGDTCVDNRGLNAPYVTVSSIFDGGAFRVQPGQRVMFEHGSLREVVDNEKESCGCPPEPKPESNEFPVAQSEGLAPGPPPAQNAATPGTTAAQVTAQFGYDGSKPRPSKPAAAEASPSPPAATPKPPKKPGFFGRVGHFFKKIFGG